MSFWDQWAGLPGWATVQGSQAYTEGAPKLQHDLYQTLRKYGVEPTDGQLDILGMTREQWNANSTDPNSVVAMLQRNRTGQDHSSINDANNAGLEESGALASGLNANGQEYARGYTGAVNDAGNEASGEIGTFTGAVGGAFNDAEKNAVPPVAAPAPPPPAAGVGLVPGQPQPQGPYPRTGPEAGGVAMKLKRPRAPVLGGMGHIT